MFEIIFYEVSDEDKPEDNIYVNDLLGLVYFVVFFNFYCLSVLILINYVFDNMYITPKIHYVVDVLCFIMVVK